MGDGQLAVVDEGVGPPLLFVHGFPLNHSMWNGQRDRLSSRYRLLIPDLRGFGGSSAVEGIASMEGFADDLARMLDALGVTEPVTFVGLSMGGYIAWQFWRRHADRLGRLVLCDTRALPDSEEVARGRIMTAERVLVQGAGIIADPMLERLFAPGTRTDAAACVEATRQVIMSTSPLSIAAALRGMAQRVDATAWLPAIDVPTLVVCGEHDAISPPAEMRSIAAAMPRATYVQMEGVGHMAPLEAPSVFNERLERWLENSSDLDR